MKSFVDYHEAWSEDGPGLVSEPNLTPFVDVLLVLLMIFMVSFPIMQYSSLLELPKVDKPTQSLPQHNDMHRLSLMPNGQIHWQQGERRRIFVSVHALQEALQADLNNATLRPEEVLYLDIDRSLPYERVAALLVMLQTLGMRNLGFNTELG